MKLSIPSLHHHKASGQGRVKYLGKHVYFGPWGAPETEQAYRRWAAELIASEGVINPAAPAAPLLVSELAAQYAAHLTRYYRQGSTESENIGRAIAALAALVREPELVASGELTFPAQALVVPSSDPEEKRRYGDEVEAIAMRVAIGFEEGLGADVRDVSKPQFSRAVGLDDWCGFDLRSKRPEGTQIAIKVKGRARTDEIELSENEWAKARTLSDKYWLYVVYDCATANPRLVRVQNPFGKLLAKVHGGAIINASEVYAAGERD